MEAERRGELIYTAGVVVFSPDFRRVLLVEHGEEAKQRTGVFGFPAGRIEDFDRSEREAAVRELEEETGYTTDPQSLEEFDGNTREGVLELKGGPENFHFRVFVTRAFDGKFTPTNKTIPRWVLVDRLRSLDSLPNVPELVESALRHIQKND